MVLSSTWMLSFNKSSNCCMGISLVVASFSFAPCSSLFVISFPKLDPCFRRSTIITVIYTESAHSLLRYRQIANPRPVGLDAWHTAAALIPTRHPFLQTAHRGCSIPTAEPHPGDPAHPYPSSCKCMRTRGHHSPAPRSTRPLSFHSSSL